MQDSQFKDILLSQSDLLFRLAFRMLRNTEDAQDALSEIILRAWSKREKIKTYDRIEAVLFLMIKNHCIDIIRKHREVIAIDKIQISSETDNSGDESKSDRLESIISNLPELQHEILHLRMVEGLTMSQIADLKGIKVNTVEVTLSRARKKIRSEYNERYRSN